MGISNDPNLMQSIGEGSEDKHSCAAAGVEADFLSLPKQVMGVDDYEPEVLHHAMWMISARQRRRSIYIIGGVPVIARRNSGSLGSARPNQALSSTTS